MFTDFNAKVKVNNNFGFDSDQVFNYKAFLVLYPVKTIFATLLIFILLTTFVIRVIER